MEQTINKGTHKLGTISVLCTSFSKWSIFLIRLTKIIEVLVEQLDCYPLKLKARSTFLGPYFSKVGMKISLNVVGVAKWIVLIFLALLPKSIGVEFPIVCNKIIKRRVRVLQVFDLIFFIFYPLEYLLYIVYEQPLVCRVI